MRKCHCVSHVLKWLVLIFGCKIKIYEFRCTFSEWLESYLPTLLNIIENNEVMSKFLDDDEKSYLRAGKCSISGIEIEAISIKENWNIKVINLDNECVKIDEIFNTVESPKKEITIINAEGYFGIKI